MGKVIWSDSSMESVWSARLTGLQVMVVWRPSVSRTVNLHTATMGVHRACFLRYACPSHSPSSDRPGVIPPCLTQSPSIRAPARERQAIFSVSRRDPFADVRVTRPDLRCRGWRRGGFYPALSYGSEKLCAPLQIGGGADRPHLLRVHADRSPRLRHHLEQGVIIGVHPVRPVVGAQVVPQILH